MKYTSVEQARGMDGVRLALSVGVPGPWCESAKQILEIKHIPYIPVAQYVGQINSELLEWTGVRNAPVAVYAQEEPKTQWSEILALAERLRPAPALLPADSEERALVLAISNDICGVGGVGWCRRLMLIELSRSMAPVDDTVARIQRDYGFDPTAIGSTPERLTEILRGLAARLHRQRSVDRDYFVGDSLRACDIYWACFSLMVRPPAQELAPMPDMIRSLYATRHPLIEEALEDILIQHRDFVFKRHLKIPLDC